MIRVWILPLSIFLFFNLHASLNEKWNPIWLMKEGVKNGKRRWSLLIKYFIHHLEMVNLISILIIHTNIPILAEFSVFLVNIWNIVCNIILFLIGIHILINCCLPLVCELVVTKILTSMSMQGSYSYLHYMYKHIM